MMYIPHTYQREATAKILDTNRTGLFLDMGLGKTVITLTAINELMYSRFDINKVLVIAPLRVAEATWSTEAKKWDHLKHLRISKILGSKRKRLLGLYTDADIYIINRENVVWLMNELSSGAGSAWDFDMVVIDELSSFKSAKAERFKALRKYISKADRVVGLTGTPAPNGLMDLWSQMYLIDGGERLGKTITGYRQRFFVPNQRNATTIFNYKPVLGAEQEILNRISDICMSMKAEDYLELPERIDIKQEIYLSDKELAEYHDFERTSYLAIQQEEITAVSAAGLTNKLLQYANGAVYTENGEWVFTNDKKLKALEEIVELSQGKPVLCFYSYKHDLERILKKFPTARKLQSEDDIVDWNKGEIPLMLAHPASAGHGLNLQAGGNIIVWFGLTWSLELYQQANARLFRQGQRENVIIHHLICPGTVDEDVMTALAGKADVQNAVLDAVKARVTGGTV